MKRILILLFVVASTTKLLALPPGATINYVDLTGSTRGGRVWAVTANQQAGESYIGNSVRAGMWSGNAASHVDLTPANASVALITGFYGQQQVGMVGYNNFHAGLWSGTAASFVDLHPAGAYASEGYATSGSKQVGAVFVGPTTPHASVWSGSAGSLVDLHPAGATFSYAMAAWGEQQGGLVQYNESEHAALWSGSAGSFIDLHPGGQLSRVEAMFGNQQAGYAFNHAALWFGSAASFVDLNPRNAVASSLDATIGGYQAGWADFNGLHAGLWAGTAGSFVDLHLALGAEFSLGFSAATSLAMDGSTLVVGGYARKNNEFSDRPILWTITGIPEPQGLSLLSLGAFLLWFFRTTQTAAR